MISFDIYQILLIFYNLYFLLVHLLIELFNDFFNLINLIILIIFLVLILLQLIIIFINIKIKQKENEDFCPICKIKINELHFHCNLCQRCIFEYNFHSRIYNTCINGNKIYLYNFIWLIYLGFSAIILYYDINKIIYFYYNKNNLNNAYFIKLFREDLLLSNAILIFMIEALINSLIIFLWFRIFIIYFYLIFKKIKCSDYFIENITKKNPNTKLNIDNDDIENKIENLKEKSKLNKEEEKKKNQISNIVEVKFNNSSNKINNMIDNISRKIEEEEYSFSFTDTNKISEGENNDLNKSNSIINEKKENLEIDLSNNLNYNFNWSKLEMKFDNKF